MGCAHGPGGPSDPGLSFVEARTHFNAWCIVSSPLTLSHDMTNDTISDAIWPIITNTEALAVSAAWHGFSGSVFGTGGSPSTFQYFYKPVDASNTAVLLMNHGASATTFTLSFADVPGLTGSASYKLRDMNAHADIGTFSGTWSTPSLPSHDSAFIMITAA